MSWYPQLSTGKLSFYRHIPKIDLHRHLEGSLRLDTLRELAETYDISLPSTDFHSLVQMQRNEPLNFSTFLSKFSTLRQFYRSPEIIQRITNEAIADAAADGLVYLELRYTPVALTRLQGFSIAEVMDWVGRAAREASKAYGVQTRLIISMNRHEPVEFAENMARLAVERMNFAEDGGVVGIDLCGNEAEFSALPFVGVFRAARQAGLRVTAHAGEWGSAANIREAIEALGVERVGHGVRVLEDASLVDLARERSTVFEVCITSNYQSGVVPAMSQHPLVRMLNAGLSVTINTDDPGVSNITLSDEYRLMLEDLGINQPTLADCIMNSAQSAFLPKDEVDRLVDRMRARLNQVLGD